MPILCRLCHNCSFRLRLQLPHSSHLFHRIFTPLQVCLMIYLLVSTYRITYVLFLLRPVYIYLLPFCPNNWTERTVWPMFCCSRLYMMCWCALLCCGDFFYWCKIHANPSCVIFRFNIIYSSIYGLWPSTVYRLWIMARSGHRPGATPAHTIPVRIVQGCRQY